jgi:hypothetical protein
MQQQGYHREKMTEFFEASKEDVIIMPKSKEWAAARKGHKRRKVFNFDERGRAGGPNVIPADLHRLFHDMLRQREPQDEARMERIRAADAKQEKRFFYSSHEQQASNMMTINEREQSGWNGEPMEESRTSTNHERHQDQQGKGSHTSSKRAKSSGCTLAGSGAQHRGAWDDWKPTRSADMAGGRDTGKRPRSSSPHRRDTRQKTWQAFVDDTTGPSSAAPGHQQNDSTETEAQERPHEHHPLSDSRQRPSLWSLTEEHVIVPM